MSGKTKVSDKLKAAMERRGLGLRKSAATITEAEKLRIRQLQKRISIHAEESSW